MLKKFISKYGENLFFRNRFPEDSAKSTISFEMQRLIKKYFPDKRVLIVLGLILSVGAFLRFHKLSELMLFFADPGWFYWSAKQMLVDGNFPLVGIASSHTWIHQGALWTYILGILFVLFDFNPYVPAYFVALLGSLTIFLIYFASKEMFSEKVGLISAFIYATSPLVVHDSRLAYHTSPIPTVTILFILSVYKWVKGDLRFFPISMFLIGILYNFEIATFSLIATFGFVFLTGLLLRKKWIVATLKKKKLIFYSFLAFVIPMIPMIFYDLNHGFPQTLKFLVWVFYRLALLVGFPPIHETVGGESWVTFTTYNLDVLRHLIFLPSEYVSIIIAVLAVSVFLLVNHKAWLRKKFDPASILLFTFVVIPTLAFLSQKTNSGAYLLMLFPQWIILIGLALGYVMKTTAQKIVVTVIILFVGFVNSFILVKNNYFVGTSINDVLRVAREIIEVSGDKPYNILGKGPGSQYESFVTPYKFSTWYLGKAASEKNEKLKFYVSEHPGRIELEVKN